MVVLHEFGIDLPVSQWERLHRFTIGKPITHVAQQSDIGMTPKGF